MKLILETKNTREEELGNVRTAKELDWSWE